MKILLWLKQHAFATYRYRRLLHKHFDDLRPLAEAKKRIDFFVGSNRFDIAIDIADNLRHPGHRDDARGHIVKKLLELGNIEKAKQVVKLIRDPQTHDHVLMWVAKTLAEKDLLADARKIISEIRQWPDYRDEARQLICDHFSRLSWRGQAKYGDWYGVIGEIENQRNRDYKLSSFVENLACRDFRESGNYAEPRQKAEQIVDLNARFHALYTIYGRSRLPRDYDTVKKIIEQMSAAEDIRVPRYSYCLEETRSSDPWPRPSKN